MNAVNSLIALVLVLVCVKRANEVVATTRHAMRFPLVVLSIAALWLACAPLWGESATELAMACVLASMAAWLVADRRTRWEQSPPRQ